MVEVEYKVIIDMEDRIDYTQAIQEAVEEANIPNVKTISVELVE